jgi:hypothetical protein
VPDELESHFARAPGEVELDARKTVGLLERAAPAHLRSVAPMLLALLEDPEFGGQRAQDVSVREAVVRAVRSAGYPWALQLAPEDLPLLAREGQAAQVRRRRWTMGIATVLALSMTVAGAVQYLGRDRVAPWDRPATDVTVEDFADEPVEEPLVLPSLSDPAFSSEADLAQGIELAGGQRAFAAAYELGLDCLAVPGVEARRCAAALAGVLDTHYNATHDLALAGLSRGFFRLQEESDPRVFRQLGRSLVEGLAPHARPLMTPRFVADSNAELLAESLVAAKKPHAALRVAERCLASNPDSVRCALVAHEVVWYAKRYGVDLGPVPNRAELQRKVAQLRARIERLRCTAVPSVSADRPPACPSTRD